MIVRYYKLTSLPNLSKALIILALGSLPACERADQANNKKQAIVIDNDTVTMAASHIFNIKSKRYQPSLGLKGTTAPINTTIITSPTDAVVHSIKTAATLNVEDKTVLLELKVVAPPPPNAVENQKNSQPTTLASNADFSNTDSSKLNPSSPNPPSATQEVDSSNSNSNSNSKDSLKANQTLSAQTPNINALKDNSSKNNTPDIKASDNNLVKVPTVNQNMEGSDKAQNTFKPIYKIDDLITLNAPFAGEIEQLYVKVGQTVAVDQPLVKLSSTNDLQFIGTLPIEAKPQLSVGQNVNFSIDGSHVIFTGQVSQLVDSQDPKHLLVYVHILPSSDSTNQIKPGMAVTGSIDYGQIEVGTIVPKQGIHDADLTELFSPPYRALVPIKANVWIIGQDKRLTQQQVEVIEYDPETEQYLVAGISNDSLICLAPLPTSALGKKVVIS